jgi:D-sedoheptulose 7-phosphate isomerase
MAGEHRESAHGDGVIVTRELVVRRLAQRRDAYEAWFSAHAGTLARVCHAMAERFDRGGRLLAVGVSPAARSDVRHVTVEFVHPVIVGKRALPALGLVGDAAPLPTEVWLAAAPDDVVLAFGDEAEVSAAIADARAAGVLTVAFGPVGAAWELTVPDGDPFVTQELVETAYHVLWELVHVFFEHRGLLNAQSERRAHDAGAASFLYPFLSDAEHDLGAVLADVAASTRSKAREVCDLREATLAEGAPAMAALEDARVKLRRALDGGGRLLTLGNGGSATDATDVVADFLSPPPASGWPARRALDLTADPAILTAIANDVGVAAMFARQIIAHGRPGDVVLALSTSGSSVSILDALAQAGRQGLTTIALVGYDGGQVAAHGLADHVIVSPSQHIPRIQEAHATIYHLLRELVER